MANIKLNENIIQSLINSTPNDNSWRRNIKKDHDRYLSKLTLFPELKQTIVTEILQDDKKFIVLNSDNKKLFLDTFRQQGIDIDKVYVERAGNLGHGPPAENKIVIFKKYLDQGIYKRIRFFDDAKSNLTAFLSLQDQYPDVSFEAFFAKSDGRVNRVR